MVRKNPWPKSSPVEVRWLDSTGTSGWHNSLETDQMECISVGHLIKRTPRSIVIAMNASHHCHGDYIEIPAVAVKRVRRLR